jgi:hypothetical protein
MAHNPSPDDLDALRKWLHDANNCVGVVLATAELLQMDTLPQRAMERCQTLEAKALEMREILRAVADRFFPAVSKG